MSRVCCAVCGMALDLGSGGAVRGRMLVCLCGEVSQIVDARRGITMGVALTRPADLAWRDQRLAALKARLRPTLGGGAP